MRKLSLALAVVSILAVGANASMSYECSFEATKGGMIQGSYVMVSADSNS